jgi:glycosyltransferase involved in cell wall biosynthesis
VRLAFLTHEPFFPPSGGGSAEAVYLVQELTRRGYEVHVFGPPVAEPERVRQEFQVQLHPFTRWRMGRNTSFRSIKYLLYPRCLQRLVESASQAVKFDLVLSQHAISAVAAGRLKRSLGVPVVMNFLDYLTGFMETWPGWLMPAPALAVLKRYELSLPRRFDADAVLTVSDTLADYLVQAGCRGDRILPIYYGYDAELFPLDEAALAARTDGPPTVVMHGSLDHHHLQQIALAAIAGVHAQRPEARFKFVGPPTRALIQWLRRAKQRVPAAVIECTGFVPYAEVARHLATASVGIIPYEASSGTHCAFVAKLVEYLALGLPVVSTPLEGVRRYFQNEPLVRFAGFDGASFSARVVSWLREPLEQRRTLGRAASERVRAALDWRVICRRAVNFVENRCPAPKGRPPHH